jgi:hypothetical protein
VAAIDDWLPRFDVHERHEIDLPIPPARALELVLSLPAVSGPIVRLLFGARGMNARDESLERFLLAHRFTSFRDRPPSS